MADLDHPECLWSHNGREPDTVGAGRLDAERFDRAKRARPCRALRVARTFRGPTASRSTSASTATWE